MSNDLNFRSSHLRAARAWLGTDQAVAAAGGDISENTLIAAEKGRACTDKTWHKMLAYYEGQGIVLREGEPTLIQIS